jgi:hypothetical protein
MKRSMKIAAGSVVLAATLLGSAACSTYDDGYGYRGYNHGPRVAVGYYNGWYDGYYGPVRDGYWRGDSFYYRTGPRGPWIVDSGRHFRHERFDGGRSFRYHGRY